MENHNWADVKNSPSAPYMNGTLVPAGAHAEQYFNPPGIHPSEPNYLWLEAGTSFGITNDALPSTNHQSTTQHLVTLLNDAGISWTSYQEDIVGNACPLTGVASYAPKHNESPERHRRALQFHHAEPVQRHAQQVRAAERPDPAG